MALTEFQRTLCRLIAQQHLASGESYVAGSVALNTLTKAARVSRHIDVCACVLELGGNLFTGDIEQLRAALNRHEVRFHEGRIHGALPRLRPQKDQ